MVDPKKLELSDDKLAYIVECFAEDMPPVLNNLKKPYFQQLICALIELWCDENGEDVDSCIQQIRNLASFNARNIMVVTDVIKHS